MADNTLLFEELLDLLDGRLSPEEAARVEDLMANADDQTDARWLAAFHRLSQETILVPLPGKTRTNLTARFSQYAENRRHAAAERPGFLQRLIAVLTSDSAQQYASAGLRAGATVHLRQLIYSTDVADIVLNVQPRTQGDGFDLLGQIMPKRADFDPTTCSLQLHHEKSTTVAIDIPDELGEFSFEAPPRSGNTIIIVHDLLSITVPLPDLVREG